MRQAASLWSERRRRSPLGNGECEAAAAEFSFSLAAGERITRQPPCIASPIAQPRPVIATPSCFLPPSSTVGRARSCVCVTPFAFVSAAYYARGKGWYACASGRLRETPPRQPAPTSPLVVARGDEGNSAVSDLGSVCRRHYCGARVKSWSSLEFRALLGGL